MRRFAAGREIAAKKYVARLSAEERNRLAALIGASQRSRRLLTRAQMLLKADFSEPGEGWSDGKFAEALDASVTTIERTRRQFADEGFDPTLTTNTIRSPRVPGFSTARRKPS